jgi:hypothetical protein
VGGEEELQSIYGDLKALLALKGAGQELADATWKGVEAKVAKRKALQASRGALPAST